MKNADQGIDALHQAWTSAIRRGDVDAALELLTPDYVLWAPSVPALTGREAVRALFTATLAACEIDPQFESEERLVSGDLAVERGWDVQTIRPRSGGAAQTRRQRVFLVLQCDGEGKWRYARGISQPGPLPAS
jgi:uncharacterized protein (TIGR02246 family)